MQVKRKYYLTLKFQPDLLSINFINLLIYSFLTISYWEGFYFFYLKKSKPSRTHNKQASFKLTDSPSAN
jgi:hypothetical protein